MSEDTKINRNHNIYEMVWGNLIRNKLGHTTTRRQPSTKWDWGNMSALRKALS